jgi:hypothetical protein
MQLRVYVDWDYVLNGTTDFTTPADDITPYYQHVSIRAGNSAGERVARVGACTITVRNTGREFSPSVPGGPFAGKLLPLKPVKIDAVDGGTTWTLFRGFTRTFTPSPDRYGERRAVITCVDWIGLLQDTEIDLPLLKEATASVLVFDVINYALRAPVSTTRLNVVGIPAPTDYMQVRGTSYTFRSTLTAPNDVLIGTGATARYDCIDNLIAAINGWDGGGTRYHASTTRPDYVRARRTESAYQQVMDSAPVRYYRLSESSGSVAHDIGSNGAHGTFVGGVTLGVTGALSGDVDLAASFDGVNDYVRLPTIEIASGSFSLECWIKPSVAAPPATQGVIAAHTAAAADQTVRLIYYNTGQLVVNYFSSAIGTAIGAVGAGVWHHLVYSFDHAADSSVLYVDGVAVASGTVGPMLGRAPVWTVGALDGGVSGFFKGDIDDVAIYRRPLTAAEVSAHFAARTIAPGLTLYFTRRGSVGNNHLVAVSGSALTLDSTILSGGDDYPTGQYSVQASTRPFPYAGDAWDGGRVNALTALQQIVESERGRLFVQRNGTLTFENGEAAFKDRLKTPVLTLTAGDPLSSVLADGSSGLDETFNSVRVQFTPHTVGVSGVVARSNAPIKVPGRWGDQSSDPNRPKEIVAPFGQTVVSLPYVDPDTGQRIGATDLILPLIAGLDWEASETRDGSYGDYTYYSPQVIFFSVAQKATGVDITIKNTALGTLYVRKLQVRGLKLLRYDPQVVVKEDAASISAYGRHVRRLHLPLETDPAFATAVAEYELRRAATPLYRVRRLRFRNLERVAGVNVFALNLGDVLRVYEYQTLDPAAVPLLRVCGLSYEIGLKGTFDVTLDVELADQTNVGLYENATSTYDGAYYAI